MTMVMIIRIIRATMVCDTQITSSTNDYGYDN